MCLYMWCVRDETGIMAYKSPKLMFTHMQSHARKVGDVLRGSTGSSVLNSRLSFLAINHPILNQYMLLPHSTLMTTS
jgi:hypothetical protein